MLNAAKLENSFFLYFAAILKIGEDSNNNVSKSILNNIYMHSTPQQDPLRNVKNDDLDLLVIVANFISFVKKHAIKLALASLAGLFCGLVLHFVIPKFYNSKVLMESAVISNTEAKAVVENWNDMLRPGGYPYLMKELNCSRATIANMTKIIAEPLNAQNEGLPGFIITVAVHDTSKLNDLQTALLNGFNDNPYIKRRIAQHRQAALDQIHKADEELNKLDSARGYIEHTVGSVGKDRSGLILDVSDLSSQKLILAEKKAIQEEKLEFVDGALLIQGFTATTGPKPGLLIFIAAGLLGGFFLGYFFILLGSLNRNLKDKF